MCCHRGAPLHMDGGLEDRPRMPATTAWCSEVTDGVCVRFPARIAYPGTTPRATLSVVEQDGFLWISGMGDPALADLAKIVAYPWHNDTAELPQLSTRCILSRPPPC